MKIVDRPGYFGKRRPAKVEMYDFLYGEGRWQECWEVEGRTLGFEHAVALYDLAYEIYLRANPLFVAHVARLYGNCYDNDPSNVACGVNHDPSATPRHIQDVSVRRALASMGMEWAGPKERLLQIRGPESEGFLLNPGNVPFHRPDLILRGTHAGPVPKWAKPESVEAFWQANKVIVVSE